jgi:hypothetical protein
MHMTTVRVAVGCAICRDVIGGFMGHQLESLLGQDLMSVLYILAQIIHTLCRCYKLGITASLTALLT